jgi:bifunctional DNA-binding transcriptional regulator/antitoxin component of YhaV-PrlF toxin-antitoxin module
MAMKSAKVRRDYTVEIPEEMRGRIRPGDSLDVIVTEERVTYSRRRRTSKTTMRRVIDRIRRNPHTQSLSDAQIENIIHETRQKA